MTIFYIGTSKYGVVEIEAKNPNEAYRIFRAERGLKKMPSGSVLTSNPKSDFLSRFLELQS